MRHPTSLKTDADQNDFAELQADLAVVVAYGLILPQAILDAPKHGCLNIHASLLPRWRGAAPIQRAIMAGDDKTGVTIMQMEAGLDTGPMLLTRETPIGATDTANQLHDRLSDLGAAMIVEAIDNLPDLTQTPQPTEGVTYAAKIEKAEAAVDWSRDATEVSAHIRGLSPFPGAYVEVDGERIKLLNAELADGSGQPGTVLEGLTVACGSGAVRITRAQRQGKRPMNEAEFLRGYALPKSL